MSRAALSFESLESAVSQLPDNALSDVRRAALERFSTRGFPGTRDEDWTYTDLASVIEISDRWLESGAVRGPDIPDAVAAAKEIDAHWLVIANGRVVEFPPDDQAPKGLRVSRLADKGMLALFDMPLTDLNAALLEDGLHIRVDAMLDKPLGILVADSAMRNDSASHSRVEIEVARNAGADFIEYHVSSGEYAHYSNSVFSLSLCENAVASYVRIQDRSRIHSQTGRLSVSLARDARLTHSAFDLGGRLIRNDLQIDIRGVAAEARFDGLYIAGDDQHIDNHTRVDHRIGPAVSRQEYRGILKGRARCVWNGKANVHDDADGTDAEQANHNLLLSDNAEINAKPELEIYADDVKCSHGTTVGQLDETALFYLRSRGLDRQHATRVLTHAFAAEIVTRMPIARLGELVTSKLEQRLGDLAESG